jgi:hypothetical protein
MTDRIVHPYHDLMAEAKREREVADSPEGQALLDTIFKAVRAYSEFLERQGLIWDLTADVPRMKATALVVIDDYNMFDQRVTLKDGAVDRVYGNGTNPDFLGRGPPDIPHKPRPDPN